MRQSHFGDSLSRENQQKDPKPFILYLYDQKNNVNTFIFFFLPHFPINFRSVSKSELNFKFNFI